MAEQSFTDRLQRAFEMKDIIALFTPAYNPGAPAAGELDLRLPAFTTRLNSLSQLNEIVADTAAMYGQTAMDRAAHLDRVLAAATSVLAYLRSKKGTLGTLLRGSEVIVKRMRGARPKKKAAPPAPGDVPPAPERNRGQQSYMEQAGHLSTLINLLTGRPGYAPPAGHPAELANLGALLSSFRSYNVTICQQDGELIHAESARYMAYYKPNDGLHDHFHAIKEAVKGQYGATSPQYTSLAGKVW
jgi:hypothetical protein